jgi:hypothetical protein
MWGSQSGVGEDSRLRNVTLRRLLEGIAVFWNEANYWRDDAAPLFATLGIFNILNFIWLENYAGIVFLKFGTCF